MTGRRLGYGQHAIGLALPCPWTDLAAIPTYFAAAPGAAARNDPRPGYRIYDLITGRVLRQAVVEPAQLYWPHNVPIAPAPAEPIDEAHRDPDAASRPAAPLAGDGPDLVAIWRRLMPKGREITPADLARGRAYRLRWLTRGARESDDPAVRDAFPIATVDGQAFYTLDSPAGRRRLFIRFHAPSGSPAAASDPDGEGYAHGFLLETETRQRRMLFSTTHGDETWDAIGAGLIAGPKWLFEQPVRWMRGD
jgi:hypothetical protein